MVVLGADMRLRLGLMKQRHWHVLMMWPLGISTESGQYLVALVMARPGQVAYLPALIAWSQVNSTGKPTTAW